MGFDLPMHKTTEINYHDNIYKIETRKIPILGTIVAGEPIYTDEQSKYYVEGGTDIKANFCLKVKGDSVTNARIYDGDIVFIRKLPLKELQNK